MSDTGGPRHKFDALVMGVSTGGTVALREILPTLNGDLGVPIMIVQHVHPDSGNRFIRVLEEESMLDIKEAADSEPALPGVAYFAPPGLHLQVEKGGILSLSSDEPVNFARPSIDVLFESAAQVYRKGVIAVILTGANSDGSLGMKCVKERGGLTVVQDPATAEVDSMPRAAMRRARVDHIFPLESIGGFLNALLGGNSEGC